MNDASAISKPPGEEPAAAESPPTHIGRYRVERKLGAGGFGVVYLARDEQLQRPVAIKVPHRRLVASVEDAEAYLTEARAVASLDHPHVAPVFDVGSTGEFLCFVVSKYIDGSSLAARLKQASFSLPETLELLATVAETLHYAHTRGLVHRDVKPGNILLDQGGQPYLTDFGLALREPDVGLGPRWVGTPDYMSPEQARGEGHRVDGRSDIFSLGVVLYEMLTGRRPFSADSREKLLDQIATQEARPPRQRDDTIPKEVERICLKALSKAVADRYTTAKDLADDLRQSLAAAPVAQRSTVAGPRREFEIDTLPLRTPITPPASDTRSIQVESKGLRSFDESDATFFLDLLPGPRGRDGLPESIGFWKRHAETLVAEKTFSVGLLYGPSGCGKSSLVKAGLLPRLSERVIAVHLDATPDNTERQLAKQLQQRFPDLPPELSLKDRLAALRQGRGIAAGRKLLIVLDQFEQWLHANSGQENSELVQVLRQCDGGRVQCILMVRDDFWMAATRLLKQIEVEIVKEQNSKDVDLFPAAHAKKVLTAFGRYYKTLTEVDPFADDKQVQALLARLAPLPDSLAKLRTAVDQALANAQDNPAFSLIKARSALEFVLRDVFERRIQTKKSGSSPPPLENVLQQLGKGGYFPGSLSANADYIKEKGNRAAHDLDLFTTDDVRQSLAQLPPILDWYLTAERPEVLAPATGGNEAAAPPPRQSRLRISDDGQKFLDQAIASLAQDGLVICVRLALFAYMLKDEPWTPQTLDRLGEEGVGVAFLEKQFGPNAPAEHRPHLKAVLFTLRSLLPPAGTDIRGHVRSRSELLAAAGYLGQPDRFADLFRILDNDLRLITPTDPEKQGVNDVAQRRDNGQAQAETTHAGPDLGASAADKYYQLTHDYLVPSLRKWLARKQGETPQGRAELLLADRAAVWKACPENRQLPSLIQWLRLRRLTDRKKWTDSEIRLMARAGRVHALRSLAAAAILATTAAAGLMIQARVVAERAQVVEQQKKTDAALLVKALLSADPAEAEQQIEKLSDYRPWVVDLLRDENQKAKDLSPQKLNTSLALLALAPGDAAQIEYLYGRLVDADPHEIPAIRGALLPYKARFISGPRPDNLWYYATQQLVSKSSTPLHAAAALALYAPESPNWAGVQASLARELVRVRIDLLGDWKDLLRPLADKLVPELSKLYYSPGVSEVERSIAISILVDYAANDFKALADLAMSLDSDQFELVFPKLKPFREQAIPLFQQVVAQSLSPDPNDPANEVLAKRQANAALALLYFGQAESLQGLLVHPARPQAEAFGFCDPRLRSYLIQRLAWYGQHWNPVPSLANWNAAPDVSIRRGGLLLALGEIDRFSTEVDSPPRGNEAVDSDLQKLHSMYLTDNDPGAHAAAEWWLRVGRWGEDQSAWLQQTNEAAAKDDQQRAQRLAEIQQSLLAAKNPPSAPLPRWYVNSQGQTLVVIPGPVTFLMGSPKHEAGRASDEAQHKVRIGRTFALAATPTTLQQYQVYFQERFHGAYQLSAARHAQFPDQPAIAVNWFMAADYCNWLSQKEQLQPCYEISEFSSDDDFQSAKVALKPSYLSLSGYRLSTEAETEYATRAGTLTSRYFGESEDLLPQYAWYVKNANNVTHRVGSLKPNDLGLFDTLGNVWTWCQERYQKDRQRGDVTDDVEDKELAVGSTDYRVMRGGSWSDLPTNARSAYRYGVVPPGRRSDLVGFRVARTLLPGPATASPVAGPRKISDPP